MSGTRSFISGFPALNTVNLTPSEFSVEIEKKLINNKIQFGDNSVKY